VGTGVFCHKMTSRNLSTLLFVLLVITMPMSVTPWNKAILVFVFLISVLLLSINIAGKGSLKIERFSFLILLCYLFIFVVGFISLMFSASHPFGMLLSSDTFGRIFTVSALLFTLLAGYVYLGGLSSLEIEKTRLIWLMPGGIFVLLGVYQVYCNFSGSPFIIETRDWMHGVPAIIRDAVPKRVTSIAEEPSFVAPILIETFLLSIFLINQKWIRLSIAGVIAGLLLLTFSGGGYVNALLLGVCAFCLFIWRFPIGKIHLALLSLLTFALIALFTVGQILVEFATNKFVHESSGGSSRAQFMSDLVQLQFDAPPLSLMFGHGLTSLSYLEKFGMRAEDVLFRISNNMFLDILWESGVIGLVAVIAMFSMFLLKALSIQMQLSKQLSLSLLLTLQMLFTSLYRSEYISSHLVWMLLLIVWALAWEHGKITEENKRA
jgi:hypothetical protein